ncbi:phosphoserine aminotransferase apoenzyme [Cyclonatronum proteinivorum]|uniref:Phosphoserine aminotransferase n=1 Tax=Cyclonatronum proteinivorum TaxID=1457365 RepID=A0A345UHT4_9BACT|nr:3-phosphoserine/phosphohydroxythreonine transaminase [Cyclonatronum proteinivorum]AXJ00036.1 phosphoserine aminotransferase apoenzyme [Cyclonatronum proteinivorum]
MSRAHNFSAGPAALPLETLQEAQQEFLDFAGSGSSVIELSHRGAEYVEVDRQARERLTRILGLGDDFEVLFLQGGASHQFMMVPFNFLGTSQTADYINTGTWSKKAIKEAKLFGRVNVAYSSEELNFSRVPADSELTLTEGAEYVHFTSNNTIFGTQFRKEPETAGVPLVCDASSDFLSRPLDVNRYGIIYAGAQKNAGPAGLTIVIIRKDFLQKGKKDGIPTILNYNTHLGTMFNTPPVFGVYMFNKVLAWIEKNGGLAQMESRNAHKAQLLYNEIDADDFYSGTTEPASRSHMNVTFRLKDEELNKAFLQEAEKRNLKGLKGHRSVGGFRASIYNACETESVEALVAFMKEFRR